MVSAMSTFHSKKGALYPARCNIFPKLLNSRREFVIPDDFETINTGEPFLLMNDGEEDKILGFSTDANLDYLCQVDTIFEDGKFYVTPNLFHQLYTLHALIAGQLLPLVFFLLRDKQEVTYQRMFHLLIANCQTRGYQLLPDIIQDVNPETFVNVLLGNETGLQGVGSGKMLKSGPRDHVFVNFVDHGGPGLIAFGMNFLKASKLHETIWKMHDKKSYAKEDLDRETIKIQYEIVRSEVNTSHVEEYGLEVGSGK
ncbi:uncharacterized protein [Haliotis cracherodii]|uniref:uncharacterized protein isoform X3 n=1 Tax=Haliotis cracherodii TaxID=6455 RepID=UPI0039EA0DC9